MAMSRNSVRTMNKLKELVWFFMGKYKPKCCFCKQPILTVEALEVLEAGIELGNATAPGISVEHMTIHHADHDHFNNDPSNWKLAHQTCHKKHHANDVFSAINGRQPRKMRAADFRRAA
jgi:hypothetical protein